MKKNKGMIFFDGLCLACSTEINHYQRLPGSEKFEFIDITDPQFQPTLYGIDPHLAHKVMHVQDRMGQMHQGVAAFRAIWREIPRYHFLYRWSAHQPVKGILNLGYKAFVQVRPFLPRKKSDCSARPYCELKK